MRLRRFQLALATIALTGAVGCAGGAANKADDGYVTVCTDSPTTGSQIARPRCYRKYDQEEQTRRDRAEMQRLQSESVRVQGEMKSPQLVRSALRSSASAAASHGQHQGR